MKALVFDFDGLILDTELPEFECWQEIYAAHGCVLAFETWAACIGTVGAFNPYEHLEAQLGRPLDVTRVDALRGSRFEAMLTAQPVLPGVAEYLAAAGGAGLRLGVASSSSRAWVQGHLARLGLLERFEVLRCAEDVERVKPDPALYLAAAEALGVRPEDAIALEDSPNGVRAAKRAGMFCVAVPNRLTARLDLGEADLTVPSLAELPLEMLLARARR